MPTLANILSMTAPVSALRRKARRVGISEVHDMINLAVARGCNHYSTGDQILQKMPSAADFADDELTILLLVGENPYQPTAIRCAAQMARSARSILPDSFAWLSWKRLSGSWPTSRGQGSSTMQRVVISGGPSSISYQKSNPARSPIYRIGAVSFPQQEGNVMVSQKLAGSLPPDEITQKKSSGLWMLSRQRNALDPLRTRHFGAGIHPFIAGLSLHLGRGCHST